MFIDGFIENRRDGGLKVVNIIVRIDPATLIARFSLITVSSINPAFINNAFSLTLYLCKHVTLVGLVLKVVVSTPPSLGRLSIISLSFGFLCLLSSALLKAKLVFFGEVSGRLPVVSSALSLPLFNQYRSKKYKIPSL